ncbi:MAG: hypothetical protein MJ147_00885 [Clostridia bacterium]|nr:hypothetical protein [Clostridia bacterium]
MNESFYKNQNLKFNKFPKTQFEGAFLGNGSFGASLYHDEENTLIIKTGHNEVFDIRPKLPTEYESEPMFISCRIPIGYFKINTPSAATECEEELDIYTAEFTGKITTENGGYKCSCITDKNSDLIILKIKYADEKPQLQYVPQKAMSPRQAHMIAIDDYNRLSKNYPEPKEAEDIFENEINTHFQPYFSYGGYAVSYKVTEKDGEIFALISCAESEEGNSAVAKSVAIIENAEKDIEKVLELHKKKWAEYHAESFLSLNDKKFEQFYHLQMYKLACAAKADGVPFDTCSVWLYEKTAWPDAWWNLNVELSYSPLYVSNHLDIAHSLTTSIKKNFENLKNNVLEEYRHDSLAIGRATDKKIRGVVLEPGKDNPDNKTELGNLTWAMYYCWQEYQMTLDKSILSEVVYPALKGATAYYSHFLYEGEDGKLHLPRTASPEYIGVKGGDVNYDMGLMRWGFATLNKVCEILGVDDGKIEERENILKNLADYPHDDEEGFYISAETKYEVSHRHYSHLLAFYPLRVCKDEKLLRTSLEYWQSKKEALLGYSQTGAASMRAMLHEGNLALQHLNNLFKGFITPNSMYNEDGNPVIETPLSAATSMQDMLIQSHDGIVDIFPAVPDSWTDICFKNFRAWGGFMVDAEKKDGKTKFIKIHSLCGEKCIIKADAKLDYPVRTDGLYEIKIKEGETVTINAL